MSTTEAVSVEETLPAPYGTKWAFAEKEWLADELRRAGTAKRRATDPAEIEALVQEGGMPEGDAQVLLYGVRNAAGEHGGTFLLTVTDGSMVDMAFNMLRSLDVVPSLTPRLVVGMGDNICANFVSVERTTCVEVFRDSASEEEAAWGSHRYWQVVFRKHVILTLVATSKLSTGVVYVDPDVVFLDTPVGYFGQFAENHDIVFSPNNMLEANARSVEDVGLDYEIRGLPHVSLGPYGRHADINTGLFYMRLSSPAIVSLMIETMRIFKKQALVPGHYQQFSLVQALASRPDIRIAVAAGDVLVNGNVFWGHRKLLKYGEVISIHANWMQPNLKRTCLRKSGLWLDEPSSTAAERGDLGVRVLELGTATLDARGATVIACA